MAVKLRVSLLIMLLYTGQAYSQQCAKCDQRPIVAVLPTEMGDMEAPSEKALKEKWKYLYALPHYVTQYIQRNDLCIQLQPVDPEMEKPLRGRETQLSHNWNYILHFSLKSVNNKSSLTLSLIPSCTVNIILQKSFDIEINSKWDPVKNASEIAKAFSPLITSINRYEEEQKNKNLAWGRGNEGKWIDVKAVTPVLKIGQQTDVLLEIRDCDDKPLAGKTIEVDCAGGVVSPKKIVTDNNGKAKVQYKRTNNKMGYVGAFSRVRNVRGCDEYYWGSVQLDGLPAYKVEVIFARRLEGGMTVNSNEDGLNFQASEQRWGSVASIYELLYYPKVAIKDGEQVMIMPEYQKKDETYVLMNDGSTSYTIIGDPLKLAGLVQDGESSEQHADSEEPLSPSVSFTITNHELIFFSSSLEFPEPKEEGALSPLGASFGVAETDINSKTKKRYFPLKGKKLSDPNIPYKWLYEFRYENVQVQNQTGSIFNIGSTEAEYARVRIWTL